jgi:hypothetical protein
MRFAVIALAPDPVGKAAKLGAIRAKVLAALPQ